MSTKIGQNFDYWTGTDRILRFTITDSSGASVNMVNHTIWWVLEDEPNSGSLILLRTGGSGITIAGCTADVALAASLTAGCSLDGTYHHRLSACDAASNADVMAVGYARINRSGL